MAELQSGIAIVWGAGGLTFTAGVVSDGTKHKTQSFNIVRDGEKTYVKDDLGQTVGRVDADGKIVLTINAIPCDTVGPSKATAKTNMNAWMITPGTKVVVANADSAVFDGNYKANRANLTRTNNGITMIEVEIEKFDGADITTPVT